METLVIKRILVPVDFSKPSLVAINQAISLAKKTNAEIILVHVIDALKTTAPAFYYAVPGSPEFEHDLIDYSNKELNKIADRIKKKGVAKVKYMSVRGQIYKEVVKLSKKAKVDIIVMGTHGISGFKEFFMGSNAFRVVSHAECPVLSIQKHTLSDEFKNIIVPFNDQPHSREKINYAIDMAILYGAVLHVLAVDTESDNEHFNKLMLQGEQIKDIVTEYGVKCELTVLQGAFVGDTVLDYAKKRKGDLIVVTSDMDRVSISEYIMGPFAQQIVNHSPIPVLSIRPTFNTDTVDLRFY